MVKDLQNNQAESVDVIWRKTKTLSTMKCVNLSHRVIALTVLRKKHYEKILSLCILHVYVHVKLVLVYPSFKHEKAKGVSGVCPCALPTSRGQPRLIKYLYPPGQSFKKTLLVKRQTEKGRV